MKTKSKSQMYRITLIYANNMTRTVQVKASSREIAENRALKRNPGATGVQR
jgi:hypothetical protein